MTRRSKVLRSSLIACIAVAPALAAALSCAQTTCEDLLSCPGADEGPFDGQDGRDGGARDASIDATVADVSVEEDKRPPTVVWTVPVNGATGVTRDSSILIRFSEPMDRKSTNESYASADLPPSAVTISWNDASTEMTLTPKAPLTLAAGSDPFQVIAKQYRFMVNNNARDLAGNRLPELQEYVFSTARSITQTFDADTQELQGALVDPSCSTNETPRDGGLRSAAYFVVGDDLDNVTTFKAWGTLDISRLPPEIQAFERATLTAYQRGTKGDPYSGSLGPLLLEHVHMASNALPEWSRPALRSFRLPAASGVAPLQANVLPAVVDAFANRVARTNRCQFRLNFQNSSDRDGVTDLVHFSCTLRLEVMYQIP